MPATPTERDRVWAAIMAEGRHGQYFTVGDVRVSIDYEHRPPDDLIIQILQLGVELGVLTASGDSRSYKVKQ